MARLCDERCADNAETLAAGHEGGVAEALERGQSLLRKSEIEAVDGWILVPVNCGQQLYDVITVTDVKAGFDGENKRVLGMSLIYRSEQGEYTQRLRLGAL